MRQDWWIKNLSFLSFARLHRQGFRSRKVQRAPRYHSTARLGPSAAQTEIFIWSGIQSGEISGPSGCRCPKGFEPPTPRFVVRRAVRGDGESPCRSTTRCYVHPPELRNLVIETSRETQPIPLIRRVIFFYDLPDRVLPGVVGDLHDASSPNASGRRSSRPLLAPTFRPVRDVPSCHNSNGFLAAPYASGNSSGILRRADRRSIFEARRQRIS